MADNENVWTQEIESEELGELLNQAASTGHPEHAYHVRYGLAKGSMTEAQAIKYLKSPPSPVETPDEDDDGDSTPTKATTKK